MTTTVTGKNQVTIPAEIARQAGIGPGSSLEWSWQAKKRELHVRVGPNRREQLNSLLGAGRKYLKPGDDPIADLIAERVRDDEEEGIAG